MKLLRKTVTEEDRAVSALIAEQRERESVAVWRRGWAISQAVYLVVSVSTPETLIAAAKKIYSYVYGDEDPELLTGEGKP
jgi:hypothetical protein